jgi:hypothetical protein
MIKRQTMRVSRRRLMMTALATGAGWAIRPALAASPASILTFGAKGDGTSDDTDALVKALQQADRIEIPEGRTFLCRGFEVPSSKAFTGGGTIKLSPRSSIIVTGDGCSFSGLRFVSDDALHLLYIKGTGTTVSGCHFSGSVGLYVLNQAPRTSIRGNTFDGEGGRQTTVAVFSGEASQDCVFSENTVTRFSGFGVQTLLGARGISITANKFITPSWTQTAVVAPGQGPMAFQRLPLAHRWGVLLNDHGLETQVDSSRKDGIAVVPGAAARPGDRVSLLTWSGLDPININSRSRDIVVDGNTVSGSGDSGIVIASDYRGTQVDHRNTTPDDYPRDIVISNNTVEFCAYAGIAETVAAQNIRHTGNTIREYGYAARGLVYPSGIVTTGGGSTLAHNTIVSNGRTTKFGINLNGFLPQEVALDGSRDTVLTGNRFEGDFDAKYFIPNMQPGKRKHSIVFTDLPETPYPARVNLAGRLTADTDGFRYSRRGEGWVYDKAKSAGGSPVAVVRDGSYGEVLLSNPDELFGSIVDVSVWAAGEGRLGVYTALAKQEAPVTCTIAALEWRQYRIRVAMTEKLDPSIFRIRIGAPEGAACQIRDIAVTTTRIPT